MKIEEPLPDAVSHVVQFLERRGIWFELSRNQPARSCRDAARKRHRLGHVGIPLRDEMKSFFGSYQDRDGTERLVIAHCRADRRLDLDAVATVLKATAPPARLGVDELRKIGSAYGLVNPFETWDPNAMDGRFLEPHAGVRQVFDEDLLVPLGTPGTVMTNAGDLTWAVELRADELRNRLDARQTVHGPISEPDPTAPRRPPFLGKRRAIAIVTGNGPEYGIALWSGVIEDVRKLLGAMNVGDSSKPPVRVDSLPELGMTMELDGRGEQVWAALAPVIERLCDEDVALLAVACNITPYFADRIRSICEPRGVEFMSMPEVVASWLEASEVTEVSVVGVPFVTDFESGLSSYELPFKPFTVEPLGDRAPEQLTELAYHVKQEGPSESALNKLRAILRGVKSTHVILALNELSLLLATQKRAGRSGKVLVDPLSLYSEALARRWLGLPFPSCTIQWDVMMCALSSAGGLELPNEDCALLGRAVVQQGTDGTSNALVRTHHEILGGDAGAQAAWVVVADGMGGQAAGADASRTLVDRIRDAMDCADDDSISRLLVEVHEELTAAGADDIEGARGTTVAGLAISAAGGCGEPLAAVAFSAGDCLALQVRRQDGEAVVGWAHDGVLPHVGWGFGGGRSARFYVEQLPALETNAYFLLCSDGFPKRLGLLPDRDVPALLSRHPALTDVWKELTAGTVSEHHLRRLVTRLHEAAGTAGPDDGRLDDVTIVLVQLQRQDAPSLAPVPARPGVPRA